MISPSLVEEMIAWREFIHAHPETAFEVNNTAHFVANLLTEWGIETYRGIGRSGVVGVLRRGDSAKKTIALRADMDALPIEEMNTFCHASKHHGKMHGCGHDGHTTMLLGAAKYLANESYFNGTVIFIFQPDEENGNGAKAMIADGIFDKWPCEEIYGMHNLPGLEAGKIAVRPAAIMASETLFEIRISGIGGHASSPHRINDPVVAAAQVINGLQSIISRTINPLDPAVVSVTEILTDGARNVIPSNITIKGDFRMFSQENVELVERRMKEITQGICTAYNVRWNVETSQEFQVTYNSDLPTKAAIRAARSVVGENMVDSSCELKCFSEDFAHFSNVIPGCYVVLGNGEHGQHSLMLHNPCYDFNNEILVVGASYWSKLVELQLP